MEITLVLVVVALLVTIKWAHHHSRMSGYLFRKLSEESNEHRIKRKLDAGKIAQLDVDLHKLERKVEEQA